MSKFIEIKNNKPTLYSANGITLQPGLNRLDEESAKKFLSHPHVKIKADRGILEVRGAVRAEVVDEVLPEETEGEEVEAIEAINLDSMSAKAAIKTIAISDDVDFLVSVIVNDSRTTVIDAAQARLEEIENSGE